MTNTGSVMGTVDYMAPEQALDARTADQRSDIYGLGCTLYYLLTGNPPYVRDTIMRRLLAHREEDIPRLRVVRPEIPKEVDNILARMLAKTQADRPASMRQLIGDLSCLNLAAAALDVMEMLEQTLGTPEGSSIVFASAEDDSARPSDSPQPAVAMKPKPTARAHRRDQPEAEHPVTEEFKTADTSLREKEIRRLREGSQRRPAGKRRKKLAKRRTSESPTKQAKPTLRRVRASDEGVQSQPKPRRSLKPIVPWLFASSWGVPRVYFAGLSAILCLILAMSLGKGPSDVTPPGLGGDAEQPGDGVDQCERRPELKHEAH